MTDQTRAERAAETEAEWWDRTLALVSEDLDTLVDDFASRLRALGSGYRHVPEVDIQRTARGTLTLLIARLSGAPIDAEAEELPRRLGIRRARQGIDRDLLLEAIRLDYRVLWAGLARAVHPEQANLLLQRAEEVLSSVEQYINDVQVAFLNERDILEQDSRAIETRAFARLLAAERPAEVAEETARIFGVPVAADYEVVLVGAEASGRAREAAAPAQRTRRRFLTWDFDDGVLFVRATELTDAGHPLDGIPGVRLDGVAGIAGVPAASRVAHRLLPFASGPGLQHEEELWAPVAAAMLGPVLPGLSPAALRGLDALPPDERERCLATVSRYFGSGSVKLTAEALFVHRNTVVNRLRVFRELTGLDPTVPRDAARAIIALAGAAG